MMNLCTEVKTRYHIAVSIRFVERVSAVADMITAEIIYHRALKENLKDITDVGTLPHGIASQVNSTLTIPVVLQIISSRDATQPIRPSADAVEEEEIFFGAAVQKNTNTRLLRLVLSDGHAEIPAFELSTLNIFRSLPIPGEKLLIKEGTIVKNGAIIMTDDCVVPLGGEVQQLKKEFLARKNRADLPYQTSTGLESAPRFQPLRLGDANYNTVNYNQSMNSQMRPVSSNGGNRGRSAGRGARGGRGGRGVRGSGGHYHNINNNNHHRRMDCGVERYE